MMKLTQSPSGGGQYTREITYIYMYTFNPLAKMMSPREGRGQLYAYEGEREKRTGINKERCELAVNDAGVLLLWNLASIYVLLFIFICT